MIEGVTVRRLAPIVDERGELCELLRRDDPLFERFGQLYYTAVKPGYVKAWHRHERQTDVMVAAAGPVRVAMYDARPESPTRGAVFDLVAGRGDPALIRIPPGVVHGFCAATDEIAVLLNVPTEPYDRGSPDEIRIDPFDNEIPYDWRAHGARKGW